MIHGFAAQKFGIVKLHTWQINAIVATIEKRDSLIVQPTGSGKSMCYIIPPLLDGKTAIVISPTISLMVDQVNKLTGKEIHAKSTLYVQNLKKLKPASENSFFLGTVLLEGR